MIDYIDAMDIPISFGIPSGNRFSQRLLTCHYNYFAIDYNTEMNMYRPYIYKHKPHYSTTRDKGVLGWYEYTFTFIRFNYISLVDVLDLMCDNDAERTYYMLKGKFDVSESLIPMTNKNLIEFSDLDRRQHKVFELKHD